LREDVANTEIDGNEKQLGDKDANYVPMTLDPPTGDQQQNYYLTKRGIKLLVPGGAEIGTAVHTWTARDGEELHSELVEDEIVALANATSIEN
jgi:hypothetical protein